MSGQRGSNSSSEESSEEEGPEAPVSQELLLDELSADTLAALQDHLQRKQESDSSEEEEDGGAGVSENFGLSQFWVRNNDTLSGGFRCPVTWLCSQLSPLCRALQYDGDTARRLAEEAIEHAKGGTIAILSAPSAFKALREIVRSPGCSS